MKKILIIISLVIAWMGIIYAFSNMPSEESNYKSQTIIKETVTKTIAITNKLGITNKHPSEEKIDSIVQILNGPLRKCAHASVYFVLSILIFCCCAIFNFKKKQSILLAIGLSFLYACTDEFHQLFVTNRTGQFADVLIDTMGAIIGVIAVSGTFKVINKIENAVKKLKVRVEEKE